MNDLKNHKAHGSVGKKELEQEREKLNIIAELFGEVLFEYDIAADSMRYTRSGDRHVDNSLVTEHYVQAISSTAHVHPEDAAKLRTFGEELRQGKSHIYAEVRNRQRDGRYHWLKIEGRTIYNENGEPFQVIGRMKNIDERKAREGELLISAETDSLTGLYNHQSIMKRLTEILAGSRTDFF